jgi:transposase-like protein
MSLFQEIFHDEIRIQARERALAAARRPSRRLEIHRQHLQSAVRDLFRYFADPPPGKPPTLPHSLSVDLADAFDALIEGYVHPLVRPATKKPGQRTSPAMRRCQVSALLYIERAKRGDIHDPHPVKTVVKAYGITPRLLRYWRRTLARDVLAALREPCVAPDFIVPRSMANSAIAYRRWRNVDARLPEDMDHPTRAFKAMSTSKRIAR